jgi:hypothetical protein
LLIPSRLVLVVFLAFIVVVSVACGHPARV